MILAVPPGAWLKGSSDSVMWLLLLLLLRSEAIRARPGMRSDLLSQRPIMAQVTNALTPIICESIIQSILDAITTPSARLWIVPHRQVIWR